jgi:hypothetical protein
MFRHLQLPPLPMKLNIVYISTKRDIAQRQRVAGLYRPDDITASLPGSEAEYIVFPVDVMKQCNPRVSVGVIFNCCNRAGTCLVHKSISL